jgi:hypothetical protein
MNLSIQHGIFYVDNLHFCYARQGNGRSDIPVGRYPVSTQYSEAHGQELPRADGLGWIGPAISRDADECDIVLGRVHGGDGLIPCTTHVGRLLAMLAASENRGAAVELVVI